MTATRDAAEVLAPVAPGAAEITGGAGIAVGETLGRVGDWAGQALDAAAGR